MLRRLFTIVPILLLAGAVILLIINNIVGGVNNGTINHFYISQVSGLGNNSGDKSRWTFYSLCGVSGSKNVDCSSTSPAYPYSPKDNFGSSSNIPHEFISNRSLYYYGSRVAYACLLIGNVFAFLTLLPTILSCFLPGRITTLLSTLSCVIALFFTTGSAALLTAVHVKGKNAFNNAGFSSKLDAKFFGVLWAAVACLLISCIWLSIIRAKVVAKRNGNKNQRSESEYYTDEHNETYTEPKLSSTDESNNAPLMHSEGVPQNQRLFFFTRKQNEY